MVERLTGWQRTTLSVALAAVLAWLWRCWCIFPSLAWNELRLEPSFLLAHGLPVYPGIGEGPVSTWIYGPVAVFLYLPATLAASAASALMTAGAINVAIVIVPIFLVCLTWPLGDTEVSRPHRLLAALICIVAWPSSSLQFIQADNASVAFGLVSNLLLVRAYLTGRAPGWLAAALAMIPLASKQMSVGPIIGQLVWLLGSSGWRITAGYGLRAGLAGIAMGLAAVSWFGLEGLWLNMIEIPTRIPWTTEHGRRLWDLAPVLLVHLGLPLAFIACWPKEFLRRNSPFTLATLAWLAALPLGFAALFKLGGSINSLHGLMYFLPPAILVLFSKIERASPNRIFHIFPALVLGIVLLRLHGGNAIWQPRIAHLRQGKNLATQLKGEIWFPWNPIITFYADGQFYHVEDGLYVRFITGNPLTTTEAKRHLPARWSAMALWPGDLDYGIAVHLCPPGARVTHTSFWTLRTWSTAPGAMTVPSDKVGPPFGFTARGGEL